MKYDITICKSVLCKETSDPYILLTNMPGSSRDSSTWEWQ